MFWRFKKQSKIKLLQEEYSRLIKQANALSSFSKKESDRKQAQAFWVRKQIEKLQASG